jgi:dTDP-4-amino-4,6-dideoxygalactose transaminase
MWGSNAALLLAPIPSKLSSSLKIPYHEPSYGAAEERALIKALRAGHTGGNGTITMRVAEKLKAMTGAKHVLMTPSATSAMEIALIAAGVGHGDEVLMPSFGFVSQANVIISCGATPVFCDVDPGTMNMCPEDAERRITKRTKLLFPVHYAGIPAKITAYKRLAKKYGLLLFEDAAQCLLSFQGNGARKRHLGTFGDAGCISFHVTKNAGCGEGGALLLNDRGLAEVCEIVQEKGTNRSAFLRGQVDKYTWVGPGGSHVLSDLLSALLEVQLKRAPAMTARRVKLWERYHAGFEELEHLGLVVRPGVPKGATHNGHIYALRARTSAEQDDILAALQKVGIGAVFHFQPLHASPFAQERLGQQEELPISTHAAETIIRLPLFEGMKAAQVDLVIAAVYRAAISD